MEPIARGEWFHREFFGLAERFGLPHDHHDDDDEHNYVAGKAIEIGLAGDPIAGAEYFNREGGKHGWPPIRLLNRAPMVITAGPAAVYIYSNRIDAFTMNPTSGRDAAIVHDDEACTIEFEWILGSTFAHLHVKTEWTRAARRRVLAATEAVYARHAGALMVSSPAPHGGDVRKHAKFMRLCGFEPVFDLRLPNGTTQEVYGRRPGGAIWSRPPEPIDL